MPGKFAREGLIKATGSIAVISWFVLLFFATIAVAIVTLSASQLQGRLLSFSRSDVPLSVWQVERTRTQLNAQEALIAKQKDAVTKQRDALAVAEAIFRESQDKQTSVDGRYATTREQIIAKLQLYYPLRFEGVDAMEDREVRATIYRTVEDLAPPVLLPASKKALDDVYAVYLATLREKDDVDQRLASASNAANNANNIAQQGAALLTEMEAKIPEIVNPGGVLKEPEVMRIYDLMSEFAFIEGFALGTLYRFAILPNEFLIMVLVIAMGILGSTLQLTYDYYRSGGISQTSQFLLRPMLGAITALVLFILLKAGVLVITDSAKLGETAPLSPFFIAFVGIVSGFLSENALETVRSVGQSWFRGVGGDQKSRWAVGVKQQLSATKTIEDLSAKTCVETVLLTKWLEEEAPVPADMQRLIALWLDKDIRLLFSDIPPKRTA